MTSTSCAVPPQSSVDDGGRLLHEDDPAAQLALCLAGVEGWLAAAGRSPVDLRTLRVVTSDARRVEPVLDVLHERCAATGARPELTVHEVDRLEPPGLLVRLDATARPAPGRRGPLHTTEGTLMLTSAPRRAAALRDAAPGRVHLPGDPAYDAQRLPWNLSVDQRPAAVAAPTSVEEVVALVRAARDAGLRVAPQSTGHGAAPLHGRLGDALLLRLSSLTGVSVDAASRTVRVVGGTQWHEVIAAAAPHGLTALHGSAPDVGVVGYTLAGGMSFYGRAHGLAVNSVRAVEVVTPTGDLVRATAEEHPELFWALRGAAGNLGVVVAVEIALLALPHVYAGMLLWDAAATADVVRAWAAWTRDVPESVTTSLRVMSFPPLPELPPFLSGRRLVVVDGAVLEDDATAAELLAPLRALSPEMDTFGRMPVTGLLDVHMDPPAPSPAVTTHTLLGALDDDAVTTFLTAATAPGPLLFTELRHVGGSFARSVAGGGAVDRLDGDYVLHCVGITPTPEIAAATSVAGAAVLDAMAPWGVTGRALTFTDEHDQDRLRVRDAFAEESWERLLRVRAEVDPDRTMLPALEVR